MLCLRPEEQEATEISCKALLPLSGDLVLTGLGCPMGRGLQKSQWERICGRGSREQPASVALTANKAPPRLTQVGTAMTDRMNHVGPWGQRLEKLPLREQTALPGTGTKVSSDEDTAVKERARCRLACLNV